MNSAAAEMKVTGFVQGVGYRYFCYKKALQLQLTGWVKNLPDGSVATLVEGDRGAIEVYIKELKIGPMVSTVANIDIKWLSYTGAYDSFEITY